MTISLTTDGLTLSVRDGKANTSCRDCIGTRTVSTERYAQFSLDMNAFGYEVVDLISGHGLSEGPSGHTPSLQRWMEDMNCFLGHVRQRAFKYLPIFLGHSLGCASSQLYFKVSTSTNRSYCVQSLFKNCF